MMRSYVPFPAAYEARILEEHPGSRASYAFAPEGRSAAGGEVLIEVTPRAGEQWVGSVHRPPPTVKGALTAVHPTPHPDQMLVLAGGDAYLIDVGRPEVFEVLDTGGPVVAAYPILSESLLLLVSPWVVTAVDHRGRAWQTDRLAIDGLRLDEVHDGRLAGVADPDDDEPRDFVIDLQTGHREGGVPFS